MSGFVSAVLANRVNFWHHQWGPYITPGLSFGLITGLLLWLLHKHSLRKSGAVILLVGATVAYAAAFWTALFAFAFLSGKRILVPVGLVEAGIIGGAVGTILLRATLALTLRKFLRNTWHAFFVIGTGSGAALVLGSLGKEKDIPTLANFGTQLFIFVWQFAVAAYLCSSIYSCKAPRWLASARGLTIRGWTTRLVWAALVLSFTHLAIVGVYSKKETSPSGASIQQATGDATAWADAYRNAKFITRAEFLRGVGPVQLVVTTEYGQFGAREQEGYQMVYTASLKVGFMTKANCRRGDKFVQLDGCPCYVWNEYYGAMGDLVNFATAYENAFREAIGGVFDMLASLREADEADDLTAWNASLWPAAQDGEMYKNFLSPIKDETGASKRLFYGATNFDVTAMDLIGDAPKEFSFESLKQRWSNELERNGQRIDPSSDLRIRHEVDIYELARGSGLFKSTVAYVNMSKVRVSQGNVVFPVKGELRRGTLWFWADVNTAAALPKDKSDTAHGLVNQSIRSAVREFDLRR